MIDIESIDPKMIANNIEASEPTHPGDLLKEEIVYRGILQKKLAADMGVSYVVLNDMLNCKRPVSTQYALLFEAALGVPAHILVGMQSDYDMAMAKRSPSFMEKLKNVRKIAAML